jgi:hypothetical protein
MKYMHKKTFELFDHEQPKDKYKNKHIVIDPAIAPSIALLNRKGYITDQCCSGHPPNFTSYIGFKQGILLPLLPPGFVMEESFVLDGVTYYVKGSVTLVISGKLTEMVSDKALLDYIKSSDSKKAVKPVIRHNPNMVTVSDDYDHAKTMEQLYKWALELPDFRGGEHIT